MIDIPAGTDSTRTIPWCNSHENTPPIDRLLVPS